MLAPLRMGLPYVLGRSCPIIQTPTIMTSIVFSTRSTDNSLTPILVDSTTTVQMLSSAAVFTVFADSPNAAIAAAETAKAKVKFEGTPQLGSVIGKEGATRHFVRVWKSAPLTSDASALLGI